MNDTPTPPPVLPAPVPARFAERNALGLKLIFVGFLALLLLVPLQFVRSTLNERRARYDEAVGEITQAWGKSQRLLGPVLVVPYSYKVTTNEWVLKPDGQRVREDTARTFNAEAFFLPEQLDVTGELDPSERARGIYTTHVYAAKLHIAGRFATPDVAFIGVPALEVHWPRARVAFALSDLRGTREALTLKWAGADVPLQPGARLDGVGAGLHAPVVLTPGAGPIEFALDLTLNGSERFTVVPLGRKTAVNLKSTWADPGFTGSFLPTTRNVSAQGFNATWQVSHYGRDFPQEWTTQNTASVPAVGVIEASAFGVNLFQPLTAYRTIERAIKYGVLFLGLVFATFFLFEALSPVRLNALNYLLVGAALCLFYLGLLSLAEFIGFGGAYALAAAASVLLIGLYSWSVLHRAGRALVVSGMLSGVYGYLYFVLRMEDFALLAGTGALFALLAAVMYATRRLRLEEEVDAGATPASEVAS